MVDAILATALDLVNPKHSKTGLQVLPLYFINLEYAVLVQGTVGWSYNVGGPDGVTLRQLAEKIFELEG